MQNPLGTVGQSQRLPGNRLSGGGGNLESLRKQGIRVFVVIENRLLRDVVARLLCRQGEIELCGKGGSETSPEEVAKSGGDVELLDFVDAQWLSAVRERGREAGRAIKTIVIGMDAGSEPFLEAVRNGVTGYLLKDASAIDVLVALRTVARGEAICPPQMCAALFQNVAQAERGRHTRRANDEARLTLQQQKLMKLVARGLTNKEIAEELHLSEYTVRNHMSRLLKQLKAENRSEAVEAARGVGLEISL